jgi:hypothetical protein
MALVSFIDDAVAACPVDEHKDDACVGLPPCHKVSLKNTPDVVDDEATTDVGHSSCSETESSSGLSGNEGCRSLGRRCRFGITSLETIPATPSASTLPLNSPPGLSRAAMREARDAMKQAPGANTTDGQSSSQSLPAEAFKGVTLSRFGETSFGTVPKTPVEKAKLKSLKSIFGSPPGLSRAEKRQARDACKLTTTSWGSGEALATGVISGAGTAQERLAKMKQNAANLKQIPKVNDEENAAQSSSECDGDAEEQCCPDLSRSTSEGSEALSEGSAATAQNCRFHCTSLGTMPSTPAMNSASPASPPGLSRKAMRQARDSYKVAPLASTSWGNSQALTINPSGKPMTPPAQRAAKQRAARDSVTLAWGACKSASTQNQNHEMPR